MPSELTFDIVSDTIAYFAQKDREKPEKFLQLRYSQVNQEYLQAFERQCNAFEEMKKLIAAEKNVVLRTLDVTPVLPWVVAAISTGCTFNAFMVILMKQWNIPVNPGIAFMGPHLPLFLEVACVSFSVIAAYRYLKNFAEIIDELVHHERVTPNVINLGLLLGHTGVAAYVATIILSATLPPVLLCALLSATMVILSVLVQITRDVTYAIERKKEQNTDSSVYINDSRFVAKKNPDSTQEMLTALAIQKALNRSGVFGTLSGAHVAMKHMRQIQNTGQDEAIGKMFPAM